MDDIDQVFLKNSLNIYEVCEGNSKNAESVRWKASKLKLLKQYSKNWYPKRWFVKKVSPFEQEKIFGIHQI